MNETLHLNLEENGKRCRKKAGENRAPTPHELQPKRKNCVFVFTDSGERKKEVTVTNSDKVNHIPVETGLRCICSTASLPFIFINN